jgi:hypothetical protein
MLEVITSNNDEASGSRDILQTIGVESERNKRFPEFLIEYRSLAATSINSIKSCPIGGNCEQNGFEMGTTYQVPSFPMFNDPKLR